MSKDFSVYIGLSFNRLKVLDVTRLKNKQPRLICECYCGKCTTLRPNDVISGNVKSCGCYRKRKLKPAEETRRIKSADEFMSQWVNQRMLWELRHSSVE